MKRAGLFFGLVIGVVLIAGAVWAGDFEVLSPELLPEGLIMKEAPNGVTPQAGTAWYGPYYPTRVEVMKGGDLWLYFSTGGYFGTNGNHADGYLTICQTAVIFARGVYIHMDIDGYVYGMALQ